MTTVRTISSTVGRRLAIAKQMLAGPRPDRAGSEELLEAGRALRCLQLDPISVVARSHLLVLLSRVGPYERSALDRLLWRDRSLFEYWAHASSIVLTEDYQLHRGRMRTFPAGRTASSKRTKAWLAANEGLRRRIVRELSRRGPLPSRAFEAADASERWASSGWTSGHDVTQMLDILMTQGRIMVAGRDGQGRLWDLAERCLPDWTPRRGLADREIGQRSVALAIKALGVGTRRDVMQHFLRNWYDDLPEVLRELERRGTVQRVTIAGDEDVPPAEGFVHHDDLSLLDRIEGGDGPESRTTLLSPFDNLICDRARTRRIWQFDFTIEIYVPRAKRQFGYYVMPILHDDELIGRIDPAMDRATGRLTINAVHAEPRASRSASTGRAVAGAIQDLAVFLGAREITYPGPLPQPWKRALAGG
jgi:uncharacterized protein YcaQ